MQNSPILTVFEYKVISAQIMVKFGMASENT